MVNWILGGGWRLASDCVNDRGLWLGARFASSYEHSGRSMEGTRLVPTFRLGVGKRFQEGVSHSGQFAKTTIRTVTGKTLCGRIRSQSTSSASAQALRSSPTKRSDQH